MEVLSWFGTDLPDGTEVFQNPLTEQMFQTIIHSVRRFHSADAMTHVFHRHLRDTPPVAIAASGMTIRDAAGRDYLDASGGSGRSPRWAMGIRT